MKNHIHLSCLFFSKKVGAFLEKRLIFAGETLGDSVKVDKIKNVDWVGDRLIDLRSDVGIKNLDSLEKLKSLTSEDTIKILEQFKDGGYTFDRGAPSTTTKKGERYRNKIERPANYQGENPIKAPQLMFAMQAALKFLGEDIAVDGMWGPESIRVLKDWQNNQPVSINMGSRNGQPGPLTVNALINALIEQKPTITKFWETLELGVPDVLPDRTNNWLFDAKLSDSSMVVPKGYTMKWQVEKPSTGDYNDTPVAFEIRRPVEVWSADVMVKNKLADAASGATRGKTNLVIFLERDLDHVPVRSIKYGVEF